MPARITAGSVGQASTTRSTSGERHAGGVGAGGTDGGTDSGATVPDSVPPVTESAVFADISGGCSIPVPSIRRNDGPPKGANHSEARFVCTEFGTRYVPRLLVPRRALVPRSRTERPCPSAARPLPSLAFPAFPACLRPLGVPAWPERGSVSQQPNWPLVRISCRQEVEMSLFSCLTNTYNQLCPKKVHGVAWHPSVVHIELLVHCHAPDLG